MRVYVFASAAEYYVALVSFAAVTAYMRPYLSGERPSTSICSKYKYIDGRHHFSLSSYIPPFTGHIISFSVLVIFIFFSSRICVYKSGAFAFSTRSQVFQRICKSLSPQRPIYTRSTRNAQLLKREVRWTYLFSLVSRVPQSRAINSPVREQISARANTWKGMKETIYIYICVRVSSRVFRVVWKATKYQTIT